MKSITTFILVTFALCAPRDTSDYIEEETHDPNYQTRKFPDQWNEWLNGMDPYMTKSPSKDPSTSISFKAKARM
ncbi:hypothetical protein DSO57_1001024 [Entomophthora muscae]|uniref:Uncharacterized protein n=1 Tax=Entomophthora muscae TaxID=34485 RepID=A0ACC2UV54_9FUNG|nr:hypothetical protein DSO57_1001024 [Entomophthora muscae]